MTSFLSQANLDSAIAEIHAIERGDLQVLKQTIMMQGKTAEERKAQLARLLEFDWLLQMNAKYVAAEIIFLHACEGPHKNPSILLDFAVNATKQRNFDMAASRLGLVLEKFPQNLPARLRLCRNLMAQGDVDAAGKQFESLKKFHGDLRVGRLNADLQMAKGQHSEAVENLSNLVSDHPGNFELKVHYASLLIQNGE